MGKEHELAGARALDDVRALADPIGPEFAAGLDWQNFAFEFPGLEVFRRVHGEGFELVVVVLRSSARIRDVHAREVERVPLSVDAPTVRVHQLVLAVHRAWAGNALSAPEVTTAETSVCPR